MEIPSNVLRISYEQLLQDLDGCIEFERVRRQLVQDHSAKGKRAGRLENGGENEIPLVQLAMDVDQAELCSAAEKDTG